MTLTSFLVLARRQHLSPVHEGILKTEFALPSEVDLRHFIRQVVIFTLIIEPVGALLLSRHFAVAGIASALWQAVFHSGPAFATSGFSLWNNSLEQFAQNPMINLIIAALCYLGALGFIVLQDA
jgi:trk system potassium uptake protein TrkH